MCRGDIHYDEKNMRCQTFAEKPNALAANARR